LVRTLKSRRCSAPGWFKQRRPLIGKNTEAAVEKLEGKIEEAIVEDPIFLERRRTPTTGKPTLALDIRERKIQHPGKFPAC
jgi:hypothetical protein